MILYVRDTNVELFKGKWDNEKEYIPYWYNCIDRNWKKSYIRFVLLIKSMTVTPRGNIKYFIKLFILDVREILSLEDILYTDMWIQQQFALMWFVFVQPFA